MDGTGSVAKEVYHRHHHCFSQLVKAGVDRSGCTSLHTSTRVLADHVVVRPPLLQILRSSGSETNRQTRVFGGSLGGYDSRMDFLDFQHDLDWCDTPGERAEGKSFFCVCVDEGGT